MYTEGHPVQYKYFEKQERRAFDAELQEVGTIPRSISAHGASVVKDLLHHRASRDKGVICKCPAPNMVILFAWRRFALDPSNSAQRTTIAGGLGTPILRLGLVLRTITKIQYDALLCRDDRQVTLLLRIRTRSPQWKYPVRWHGWSFHRLLC